MWLVAPFSAYGLQRFQFPWRHATNMDYIDLMRILIRYWQLHNSLFISSTHTTAWACISGSSVFNSDNKVGRTILIFGSSNWVTCDTSLHNTICDITWYRMWWILDDGVRQYAICDRDLYCMTDMTEISEVSDANWSIIILDDIWGRLHLSLWRICYI
jgi:hypothetical protein